MSTPQSDVRELRPSWDQYRAWFGKGDKVLMAFLGVTVASIVAAATTRSEIAVLIAVAASAVLIGLLTVAISIRTSRILLGNGKIEHHRWFFRRTVIELDGDVQGLLATHEPFLASRTVKVLVLRNGSKGPRIRLNDGYWALDDLEAIARAAGVPVLAERLGSRDFEKRAPGIMHSWERRPISWVIVGTVVGFVVLFAAVSGAFSVAGRPPFDRQPPEKVSAATVSAQDALLADLTAAIGGRWTDVDDDLEKCQDDDDYKGWARTPSVEIDRGDDGEDNSGVPPKTTPELVDSISAILTNNGYEVSGDVSIGDPTAIIAQPEGASFGEAEAVQVELDGRRSAIKVEGACEVPDH